MKKKNLANCSSKKKDLIIKEIQGTFSGKIDLEKKYPLIDFGEEFEKTKEELYSFDIEINKFKSIVEDTDYFISEHFLNLRNQLDLERELSKKQIDDYFDKNIQELLELEKECIANKTDRKHDDIIEQFEKDLKDLYEDINIPETDSARWRRIKIDSMNKFTEIDLMSKNYQNDLLGNQLITIKSLQTELKNLLKEDFIKESVNIIYFIYLFYYHT